MTITETQVLYKQIIRKNGEGVQSQIAIEEMSELIKALCKYKRKLFTAKEVPDVTDTLDNIAEEIADVEIMLEQLKIIYDNADDVDKWREIKLERIRGLIQ